MSDSGMGDANVWRLLTEIRDLLREQNRIVEEIKAQNEDLAARNVAHMAKAEAMATSQMAQNAEALGGTRWLKWGVWGFIVLMLLLFSIPILVNP